MAPARLAAQFKGFTSHQLREEFPALSEQVNVFRHDFQGLNLGLNLFGFLIQEFSQPFLQPSYEDAFAVFRAPHQVILERIERTSRDSVSVIHHQNQRSTGFDILFKEQQTASPAASKTAVPSVLKTYGTWGHKLRVHVQTRLESGIKETRGL